MATKTFEYVAFWGDIAWVAGTTCFDCVCQGATVEQAVQRLSHSLYAEAMYAVKEGRVPFDSEHRKPVEKFSSIEGAIPTPDPSAQFSKTARYTGSFEVTWKEPTLSTATP